LKKFSKHKPCSKKGFQGLSFNATATILLRNSKKFNKFRIFAAGYQKTTHDQKTAITLNISPGSWRLLASITHLLWNELMVIEARTTGAQAS